MYFYGVKDYSSKDIQIHCICILLCSAYVSVHNTFYSLLFYFRESISKNVFLFDKQPHESTSKPEKMNCKKTNCEHCQVCKIADQEIIEDCKHFVSKDDKYISASDNKYSEAKIFRVVKSTTQTGTNEC